MPRRAVSLATLLLFSGLLLAAPAQAKCCALKHLRVIVPGQGGMEISAEQLDDQLAPPEQGNLYWPVLNGSSKGDHRPPGDLGARYDITYVLDALEGEDVQVREVVYLEADPPVAFAPRGQTAELYPGDVRPVPWGWRPFPERAANALLFLIDEAGFEAGRDEAASSEGAVVERFHDDIYLPDRRSSWGWLIPGAVAIFLVTMIVVPVLLHRRRRAATP